MRFPTGLARDRHVLVVVAGLACAAGIA
ncbi:MAG: hypothetical protein QOI41_1427, partial [Myxococcales bacterium]|nr:hypothetical protein [Myxococcales bacterium]